MSFFSAESHTGVVTSWIPLTSTYTPSAACSTQYRLNGPSLVAFDPGYGLDINATVICAPSAVTTWWEQGRLGHGNAPGHTVASLGPMICPKAWSTVVTSIRDGISTVAMCCPSGYTLGNALSGSVAGDCQSPVSSGLTLTYMSTPDLASTAWTLATTTLTDSSIVGAIAVVGWNINPTQTSTTTVSMTSITTATKMSHSASPAQSPVSQPSGTSTSTPIVSESGGMPTGSAIGVGVGVGVGTFGIMALLGAFYLLRRRRAKGIPANNAAHTVGGLLPQHHKEPCSVHELPHSGRKAEMHADNIHQRPPAELYGG